jgi:hypothetical protein
MISSVNANSICDDFVDLVVITTAVVLGNDLSYLHLVLEREKLNFHILKLNKFLFQVLEFKKGTIQNLYWKTNGCSSCSGGNFECLEGTTCAVKRSSCKSQSGQIDCSVGIQVAFSGTDKHDAVLNSWYEVSNMNQYSLYGLYSDVKGSITDPFKNFF